VADGNSQYEFNLPRKALVSALRPGEIVVDHFAGGGGASEALEQALGRPVDIAINHDAWALGMHAANHPFTQHLATDIWLADPVKLVAGRPVGWMHTSPDCTHFSQAKGGQPRSKATRSLSWVAIKWCGQLKRAGMPVRILSLENVKQILTWGPLVAKRCKATGRVMKMDGTVAAKGERVSVWEQSLVPDKRHAGRTWLQFVAALRGMGYAVEWRKLVASDYGAGTSRERLFMVARLDTDTIAWPAPTHGKAPGLKPLVTAADCIDFTVPCPSIFTRKKPLAEATMRRIARGVQRYVLDTATPFIVGVGGRMGQTAERGVGEPMQTVTAKADSCVAVPTLAPFITEHANASNQRNHSADEPMRTQCAQVKGGHFALAAPHLVKFRGASRGTSISDPVPTITSGAGSKRPAGAAHAMGIAAAHLVRQFGKSTGSAADEPVGALVAGGGGKTQVAETRLAAMHVGAMAQNVVGMDPADPLPTILAGAARYSAIAAALVQTGYGERSGQAPRALDIQAPLGVTPAGGVKHAAIAAFLEQANSGPKGDARPRGADEPVSTISTTGSQQRLVTANMAKLRGTSSAADATDPLHTISAGGEHHAVVECELAPEHEAGALRVAAFLIKYYGTAFGIDIDEPMDTVTTKDRLALVTVWIHGHPYVIVDIGLRMLRREELFRAQGFPPSYIIDRTADGRPLSISRSVRMVGNSVSPPPLLAIARANLDPAPVAERIAA
jgi:DNA (cytosine-5)-methyltransferase 1